MDSDRHCIYHGNWNICSGTYKCISHKEKKKSIVNISDKFPLKKKYLCFVEIERPFDCQRKKSCNEHELQRSHDVTAYTPGEACEACSEHDTDTDRCLCIAFFSVCVYPGGRVAPQKIGTMTTASKLHVLPQSIHFHQSDHLAMRKSVNQAAECTF